jgi:tetrahydromethanopterin S-methyltransferase subunit E
MRGGTVQRHPLTQFPDAVVDQQRLISWANLARNATIPAGLVCCGTGAFAWRLLLAVILAAIGLGLNSAFHGGLTFKPLMRLAVVSMAGPVFLETILELVGVNTACWGFVVFTLLALGYMVFAVKAAAEVVKPAGAASQMPPGMPPLPGQQPPTGFDERFP